MTATSATRLLLTAGLAALAVAPASAQRYGLGDLNGARVGEAQETLRINGYAKARNINVGGRQWDLWFSRDRREACIGFTSYDGVVIGVQGFPEAECGVGATPTRGDNLRPNEFEGLRVGEAQRRLQLSGYAKARSLHIGGRQWDLWRNPRSGGGCVGFASYNGRVTEADRFGDRDCNGYGEGDWSGGWGSRGRGGWGRDRFDLSELIGLRVDPAKDRLRYAGYIHAGNIGINGRQWDLWYNDRDRNSCVGFTSWHGEVIDADTFRESSCRR